MRKLIAGLKTSLDGKIEGPDGFADWVDAWQDDYGVIDNADACVLGGGMYPGYERYWTAVQDAPDKPLPMTSKMPTPKEVEYARFTARTPHYVLSRTMQSAAWPLTTFLRGVGDVAALKQRPGKDIYLIGGARVTAALMDAGLIDELRLIVYPLIAGKGKALFATAEQRRALELKTVEQLQGGCVRFIYGTA